MDRRFPRAERSRRVPHTAQVSPNRGAAGDAAVLPNGFTYDAGAAERLFTDDPLNPLATTIKAIHITELRTAVNDARVRAGLPQVNFTDAAPGVIKRFTSPNCATPSPPR